MRAEMSALGYETTKVLAARHHVSVETLLLWREKGKLTVPPGIKVPAPETIGLAPGGASWKRWGNVWLLSESVKLAVAASRARGAAGGVGRPIGSGA